MGAPGSAGLFTLLNIALRDKAWWVRMSEEVQEALADFRLLLKTAATESTHVDQLVLGAPAYVRCRNPISKKENNRIVII